MKIVLVCVVVVAVLLICFGLWRSRRNAPTRLNVEPHAAHEIEKAKQR